MLEWINANKDALVAIGGLMSPAVAVVASLVSYRAVVTGPRIQRKIARDQAELTGKQLALQERTVALAESQMSATLLGAADQKWIEEFRGAVAELAATANERGQILDLQRQQPDIGADRVRRAIELGYRFGFLRGQISLLVGHAEREQFAPLFGNLFNAEGTQNRTQLSLQMFDLASQIIEQRQTGIAARVVAASEKRPT